MQASSDRRTKNMIKDYGVLAGNSKRCAPFQKDKDDHIMRMKRVPISFAQKNISGYNVVFGDIASPGESKFAHQKIRQREKLSYALESDRQQKEKRLEQ